MTPTHTDAIADTGDGYTIQHGWYVSCLWCDWGGLFPSKTKAIEAYRIHEKIEVAREAAKNV